MIHFLKILANFIHIFIIFLSKYIVAGYYKISLGKIVNKKFKSEIFYLS